MADPDRPLLADAKDQIARLAGDLSEMVSLRWQLARLEFDRAAASVKRAVLGWAVAAVLGLTALPILALCGAQLLPEQTRTYWLLGFALGLLILALVTAWLVWRRFRWRWIGLAETLEELREDLIWLKDWAGRETEGE